MKTNCLELEFRKRMVIRLEISVTVKSISLDVCTFDLIDYGDEPIVKSKHLRTLQVAAYSPLAYRCTLDISEFTEREKNYPIKIGCRMKLCRIVNKGVTDSG